MASNLTISEYIKIQSMLHSGWKIETIMNKSGRSEHTIKRIKASKTWTEYKRGTTQENFGTSQRRMREKLDPSTNNPFPVMLVLLIAVAVIVYVPVIAARLAESGLWPF